MRQLLNKLRNKRRLAKLRKASLEPRKLPVGLTEFSKFCDEIIELSGEYADRDSMIYAIASNIVHMKHDVDEVPLNYFVKVLRKAAANQVASSEFQRIKEAHDKRVLQEQETSRKQAEATAQSKVVANATAEEV